MDIPASTDNSHKILEMLLQDRHLLVAYMDTRFNFIFVNQAYADAGQQPVDYFPGKNYFDLYPDEENEKLFQQVVATGVAYIVEAKSFEHEDSPERGATYWDWKLAPARDSNGSVDGLLLILFEVTDQVLVEKNLAVEKSKFSDLFHHSNDTIFLHDLTGRLFEVNERAIAMFGYSRKELLGLNVKDLHPESAMEQAKEAFKTTQKEGNVKFEVEFVRKGGALFLSEVSASIIELDNEKFVLASVRDISEKKEAEEALRQSEEKYRNLFNSANDAIFILDMEGNFIDVNEIAHQRLGYTREELLSKHITQLNDPRFNKRVPERIREMQETGQARFESVHMRKDGSSMPVEVNCRVIEQGGKPVMFSVVRDITEAKQAKEALITSEERYRLSFEHISEVVYSVNINGIIEDISPSVEKLFGYRPDEMIGKSIRRFRIFTPETLAKVISDMRKVLQGHSYQAKIRNAVTKDGSSLIVEGSASPIIKDGRVIGVVGLLRDVSVRMEIEERLRKLSQAVEQAGESIVITDRSGQIEYVNPAFSRMTGYSAEEAIGENPRMLKSGNQDSKFYDNMWQSILSGRVWRKSLVDRKKDGSFYPTIMSIAPIKNRDDEITHFVALQQDLTEFNMLESQLRQAQKMEAIGTLVGGIAHDFNNMLAGMIGNIYLVRKKITGMPEVDKKLEAMEKLSDRASEMIRQLLTFSRKDVVVIKPFAFTSFIKESFKLNKVSIPENIMLRHEFPDEELIVRGDATQLQQVLMNLMNNSRDALKGVENPEIQMRLEEYTADSSFREKHQLPPNALFAHVSIKDNGMGIEEQHIEHLFEPFYTTKEVGAGTGLGLSMAYGAIQSHNGILEINSKPNSGTTVHIYLPLIAEQEEQPFIEEQQQVLEGHNETILLVDDDIEVLATVQEVLESLNYRVLTAIDGREAVRLYEQKGKGIDLVIMDAVMPRLGGVEAFREIRKINSDARIIFATGYDREETLKQQMVENFIVLTKPYHMGELSQIIQEELSR